MKRIEHTQTKMLIKYMDSGDMSSQELGTKRQFKSHAELLFWSEFR